MVRNSTRTCQDRNERFRTFEIYVDPEDSGHGIRDNEPNPADGLSHADAEYDVQRTLPPPVGNP